ncbi:MAG TPA: Calx-beta domain-containing protein [Pyrinomonadaceae bacterium]|nr:Calx-beta domain-containing protein [Pyrinomonadaceae bacterium]
MIWFVNVAAAAGGDGRLTTPFNCLVGAGCFSAVNDGLGNHPASNDNIFLATGAYTGGLSLLSNQKVIGQGASAPLTTIAGVTLPANSDTLPTTGGAAPTITTIAAAQNGLNLGTGNTVRGLVIGNTTGAKLSSVSFGTLTLGNNTTPDVMLNGTGQALSLSNGTFAATSALSSLTSTSSGGQGISLSSVAGTVSFGSTTISGNTTQCVLVSGSTANISFGNTSCTGGTDGVSLQNNSAGARTFGTLSVSGGSGSAFLHGAGGGNATVNGAATLTSGGDAISINAPGATNQISFNGATTATRTASGGNGVSWTGTAGATLSFTSLTIQTNAGTGLNASGGGAITVNNNAGTINNTTQAAPAIVASGIALNAVFTTVNSSGGTNGISLTNVTGTSNFGGGTLSGASGATFLVSGGTSTLTYAGGITQANNAALVSISGHSTGTINFNSGTLSATNGTGLQFDNADGTYNFLGTNTLNGGDAGIDIQNGSAGTFTFSASTTITNPSGIAYREDTSTPSVTYNGTITKNNNAASAVSINAKTGGTTNFNGAITASTTTANAINLTSNTGGTINFTAGLSLTTTSGGGFIATGGGTVSATQNNTSIVNTISSTTGTALNVTSTTIGATGLTFRSITANGSSNNCGIILDGTGTNAGLTVTGNGTAGSGGTISNKTGGNTTTLNTTDGRITINAGTPIGVGIVLHNTRAISLSRMQLNDFSNYGILGDTVLNFTLDNSVVNGTAGDTVTAGASTPPEGSIFFSDLTGNAAITNSTVTNLMPTNATRITDTIHVMNNGGTLTLLNIDTCTIANTTQVTNPGGKDAIFFGTPASLGSGTMNLTINNTNITAAYQFLTQVNIQGTAQSTVTITNSHFTDTNENIANGIVSAGGGVNLTGGGTDVFVKYLIQNNTFQHNSGVNPGATNAGALLITGIASASGTFDGKILNNTFGATGVLRSGSGNGADALRLFASGNNGSNGNTKVLVQGNTIKRYGEVGIQFNARQGNAKIDATVLGNTINEPGPAAQGAFAAIWVNSGALPADTNQVNIAIGSQATAANKNTMQDSDPNNATDVFMDKNTCGGCASTLNLFRNGSTASGTGEALVRQILIDDNNPTLDLTAGFTNSSTIGTPAGLPPQPTHAITIKDASASVAAPATRSEELKVVEPRVSATPAEKAAAEAIQAGGTASVSLARSKTDSGTTLRYSRHDNFVAPLNQQSTDQQGKKQTIKLPRPIIKPLANAGPINIGTLRAGDSVIIMFQVTINNPYLGGPNVSNQGTISGSNFTTVLTDDPDVAGTNNPTLTPVLAPPNISVSDAQANEPATGTAPMLFTVSLSAPAPGGGVTVHYATADQAPGPGHAVAGVDYTAVPDTLLTFASGEQVKTVTVNILADADSPEPDETFLLNLSNATGGNIIDGQAIGTIKQGNAAGTFLISELRTSGPGGLGDDFVEFYNNTDVALTVTASDASPGYGLFKLGADCNAVPVLIGTIPNGTVIPARGHYLMVGSAYSLGAVATGNLTLTSDIESDRNVAVFNTTNPLSLSSVTRLDAVGFDGNTGGNICDLMKEGTTLPAVAGSTLQYSFERDVCGKGANPSSMGTCPSTTPVDTNNNATDFLFADTTGSQRLGAPGPENMTSPIVRNSPFTAVILDATKPAANDPNRVRSLVDSAPPNTTLGTLTFRRRLTNNTGAPVTQLRFRIIDISSLPTPGGIADLRALTSVSASVSGINDSATCLASTGSATTPCTVTVQGTTLDAPPQALGGALNSTLSVGTITLATPLANGASVNVQFLLGVKSGGAFKFYLNVEALP